MQAPANPSVRVFYALIPPMPLQQLLGEVARVTARRAHGRPVPAPNIHLTLAFIGQWPLARLSTLLDIGASLGGEALRIALDAQGGFRRAGIAWIAPSRPPAALMALADSLARALPGAGIALDERAFRPHVTLARHCRGPYATEPIGPFAWDADSVVLMQSDTRQQGVRYARLAAWPLRQQDQGL